MCLLEVDDKDDEAEEVTEDLDEAGEKEMEQVAKERWS